MTRDINTILDEYFRTSEKISVLIEQDEAANFEQIVQLDKELSSSLDSVLDSSLPNSLQRFARVNFLIGLVGQHSQASGLLKRLLGKIQEDAFVLAQEPEVAGTKPQDTEASISSGHSKSDKQIISLGYSSISKTLWNDDQIYELSRRAQSNNTTNDISGMLVYDQQTRKFSQVLEGSLEDVWRLMNKIMLDDRHSDLVVHYQMPIDTRNFKKWAMLAMTTEQIGSFARGSKDVEAWMTNDICGRPNQEFQPGRTWIIDEINQGVS